jgi:hypothetical protein
MPRWACTARCRSAPVPSSRILLTPANSCSDFERGPPMCCGYPGGRRTSRVNAVLRPAPVAAFRPRSRQRVRRRVPPPRRAPARQSAESARTSARQCCWRPSAASRRVRSGQAQWRPCRFLLPRWTRSPRSYPVGVRGHTSGSRRTVGTAAWAKGRPPASRCGSARTTTRTGEPGLFEHLHRPTRAGWRRRAGASGRSRCRARNRGGSAATHRGCSRVAIESVVSRWHRNRLIKPVSTPARTWRPRTSSPGTTAGRRPSSGGRSGRRRCRRRTRGSALRPAGRSGTPAW